VLSARGSSRVKKPSTLRASFTPSGQDGDEEDDAPPTIRKPNLARQALERNAAERLPIRAGISEGRPSYSADYLAELKSSQPSTPRDQSVPRGDPMDEDLDTALDIASKFGPNASTSLIHPASAPTPSLIPTDAEIREKKDRRRRLAAEQKSGQEEEDFISLDSPGFVGSRRRPAASDSDANSDEERTPRRTHSLIIPAEHFDPDASKYPETRLVRDDEDMAEGFDAFVEDAGKVSLSRAGLRTQEQTRRKELSAQIRAAQTITGGGASASSDAAAADDAAESSVDEDEAARLRAYDAAQTRAGTYGERSTGVRSAERERESSLQRRLAHQARVTPVPDLKGVLGRWREMVGAKEAEVGAARARLDVVRMEKEEVRGDEARVVVLLKEAGERFEKLRGSLAGKVAGEDGGADREERGLESLGTSRGATPVRAMDDGGGEEQEGGSPSKVDGFAEMRTMGSGASMGLGFSSGPSGMAGMAGRPGDGYDSDDY